MCICVYAFTYLSYHALLYAEPEALSIGQGVASLGGGSPVGSGGRAVAHWPPSGHYHFTACLVLIQRALTSVNHPVRREERTVGMVYCIYWLSHISGFDG